MTRSAFASASASTQKTWVEFPEGERATYPLQSGAARSAKPSWKRDGGAQPFDSATSARKRPSPLGASPTAPVSGSWQSPTGRSSTQEVSTKDRCTLASTATRSGSCARAPNGGLSGRRRPPPTLRACAAPLPKPSSRPQNFSGSLPGGGRSCFLPRPTRPMRPSRQPRRRPVRPNRQPQRRCWSRRRRPWGPRQCPPCRRSLCHSSIAKVAPSAAARPTRWRRSASSRAGGAGESPSPSGRTRFVGADSCKTEEACARRGDGPWGSAGFPRLRQK